MSRFNFKNKIQYIIRHIIIYTDLPLFDKRNAALNQNPKTPSIDPFQNAYNQQKTPTSL